MVQDSSTNTLAIIPARGGSKGIPRKNVLPIAGKPLLAHTIDAALVSRCVTRTVVSTDDPEIADVAQRYGAEVVTRPDELSGDMASSEAALLHVLDTLRQRDGYVPDLVVFLQCTSPLTVAEDIDGTVNALLNEGADTALAVAPFHYFLWNPDGTGINHDKRVRQMRQERAPQYLETGAVYVMKTAGFLETKHRFFGKTALYVMPEERCHEIDEPIDMRVAEVLLRERAQGDMASLLPERIGALVMDFDGVLTDNRVEVDEHGTESVTCSRGDGMGLSRLKKRGVPLLVLSKERNPVVQARCAKLGIDVLQAVDEKLTRMKEWLEAHGADLDSTVYVGNDINDLECLSAVGCGVVVGDAHPDVLHAANIVLNRPGGHGAVRELCDLIETYMGVQA